MSVVSPTVTVGLPEAAPRPTPHFRVTNENGNGCRIPLWFVKIVAGGLVLWMVWVTKGIFTLEGMADDVREIRVALVQPKTGGK